ncbi:YrzE family protein [Ferruginibacter sp.]
MKTKAQNTIAVFFGIVTTVAVAATLISLMKIQLSHTVMDAMQKREQVSYTVIFSYEFLWVAVSGFVGGFVASTIAAERKVYYALITGTFNFVILVFGSTVVTKTAVASVLLALSLIPLTLMGGIVRQLIENKKEDQEDQNY